jgi:glucose/mannose-6-phosphate isomerase
MSTISELDKQDLFGQAYALPDQMQHALRASEGLEGLPKKERIENVVVLGMGGSGIAGDVLVAAAAPFVPVPITVVKGYEIPAFVGEGSLVFAVSCSGDTEETVEAATEAAVQGAKIVVVSKGGKLADLAGGWGSPVVRVPQNIPQPRAAIGALAIPAIAVLEDIGLFPGARQWIDQAIEQVTKRRDELTQPGNFAEKLAEQLKNKLTVVHSSGSLGMAVAQRWKTQINENAKAAAYWATMPEVCHNEVVGWDALAPNTKDNLAIISLRHDEEHPQVMRRFELTAPHVKPNVALMEDVVAEGDGTLAQLMDLVMIGDYVSLHMAIQQGIDPGPVDFLSELKGALSQR